MVLPDDGCLSGVGSGSDCGINPLVDSDGNTIFWYVGDVLSQEINFKTSDGTAIDLTARTMNAIMRSSFDDGAYTYFDKALTIVVAVDGTTTLDILATELIDAGTFVLEIYETTATKKTIAQYDIEVKDSLV